MHRFAEAAIHGRNDRHVVQVGRLGKKVEVFGDHPVVQLILDQTTAGRDLVQHVECSQTGDDVLDILS